MDMKNRIAIITTAGISSRFNEGISEGEHVLKAIYHEGNENNSLLYHMLLRLSDMDKIVLVAGYKEDDLRDYLKSALPEEMKSKISIVSNNHYKDWSSGYSLYLGIEKALELNPESIIFAEGDLDIDDETFKKVCDSEKSVITCNHEIINSKNAVIGYVNASNCYRYAFSTTHGLVSIDEDFGLLFNSGQIWKLTNMEHLRTANEMFTDYKESGTNLIIIRDYFDKEDFDNVQLIDFQYWMNCNTREDYQKIKNHWEAQNETFER